MINHLKALGLSILLASVFLVLAEGTRVPTWFALDGIVIFILLVGVIDIWVYREWFRPSVETS